MKLLGRFFISLLCLLTVVGCSSRSTPAPVVELGQAKTFKQFNKNNSTYTVKKGDTLFSIAWYSGNDYQDLATLNKLSKPYKIFPGQTLLLNQVVNPSVKPPTKSVKKLTKKPTGQTSKTKVNQSVDQHKKPAYGENTSGQISTENKSNNKFPKQISRWVWPAKGKLVGLFSLKERGNKGIDIANQHGTPIFAAAAGKVVYTGNALRGFGNLVIIKHTDSYLTAYAHNHSINVKEQEWVNAGQQIAAMGDSDASRVMLHFEVRYKGKSVDPMRFLPRR